MEKVNRKMPDVTLTVSVISVNALHVNRLNTKIKSERLAERINTHDLALYCLQEMYVIFKYTTMLKRKEYERYTR